MSEKAPKVTLDTLTADTLSNFTPQSHEEEAIAEQLQNTITVVDKRASSKIEADVKDTQVDDDTTALDIEDTTLDQPLQADVDRPLTSPIATALDRFAKKAQMASDIREAYSENKRIDKSKQKAVKDRQNTIKQRAVHVKQLELKDDFDQKVEVVKKKIGNTARSLGAAGLLVTYSSLLKLSEAKEGVKKVAEKAKNAELAKKAAERSRKIGSNAVVLYHRGRAAADAAADAWRDSKAA